MLPFAVVPIILLVVAALLWTWWTSRQDRDPASSVDSFNRALTAMQPGAAPGKPRRRVSAESDSDSDGSGTVATTSDGSGTVATTSDENEDSDADDEAR